MSNLEDHMREQEAITAGYEAAAGQRMADHIATIWDALAGFRENCISEGLAENDEQWQEIVFAMAEIQEALGLPEQVDL